MYSGRHSSPSGNLVICGNIHRANEVERSLHPPLPGESWTVQKHGHSCKSQNLLLTYSVLWHGDLSLLPLAPPSLRILIVDRHTHTHTQINPSSGWLTLLAPRCQSRYETFRQKISNEGTCEMTPWLTRPRPHCLCTALDLEFKKECCHWHEVSLTRTHIHTHTHTTLMQSTEIWKSTFSE